MQDLLGSATGNAEVAAICMALQHILVTKGICSFNELTEAHKVAQKLVQELSAAITNEPPDTEALITAVKSMMSFVGGDSQAVLQLSRDLRNISTSPSKES